MESNLQLDRKEYIAIHAYIRYKFGKASECENPNCEHKSTRFEWALAKGKRYARIRDNFIMLCKLCHIKYDNKNPAVLHSLRTDESMKRIQMSQERRGFDTTRKVSTTGRTHGQII